MGAHLSSYLIDINLQIIAIWPKVKVDGRAQNVLNLSKRPETMKRSKWPRHVRLGWRGLTKHNCFERPQS